MSRWAVGSSAMITGGSLMSARAMATRCASPPESHSTRAAARPSRFSCASSESARSRSRARGTPSG